MKVNPERRKEWLRALRQFKYGMRVRAKMGILQTICEQVVKERKATFVWAAPDWHNDRWVTLLYTCIKDNQFPQELLVGFVKSAKVTVFEMRPTVNNTLNAVDIVCRKLSRALRHKFGVFE